MAKLTIAVDLEDYRRADGEGFFSGDIKNDLERALDEAMSGRYAKKVMIWVTNRHDKKVGTLTVDDSY
jgi:hypothetical protein